MAHQTVDRAENMIRTRFTRIGLHFVFVAAFAMLGGSLRGLNLLLVLAGLMVGAIFVQWRWCRRSMESLRLTRRLPEDVFAGEPFQVRCRIANQARLLPAWLLKVEDKIRSLEGEQAASASAAVSVVPARQSVTKTYQCRIARRGRYRFQELRVSSCFPLCLMRCSLLAPSETVVDVYPRRLLLHRNWQGRILLQNEGSATASRRRSVHDGEFFGLRPWQSGDSPRMIHWRTTARLGELSVRQFEQRRRLDGCLLIDGVTDKKLDERRDTEENVELAISLAASMVIPWISKSENRILLAIAADQVEVIRDGAPAGKRRMLAALGRLQTTEQPALDRALLEAIALGGRARDLFVFSPRSLTSATAACPGLSALLSSWSRTGRLRWIDVSNPAVVASLVQPALNSTEKQAS